jgi:AcrR family transcriptional regulator
MGVKERRLRDKIRRSNEIIDAAEKVIFEKGIQNATMDEIAQEAELGKATLYGYYTSKEEILLAIRERALKKLGEMFENCISEHKSGYAQIKAIGMAYFRFAQDFPNYYKFVSFFEANDTKVEPEVLLQHTWKINAIKEQAIRQGVQDGSIRASINPVIVSKLLWAFSTGLLQLMQVKGQILRDKLFIEPEAMFDSFFDLIENGITK